MNRATVKRLRSPRARPAKANSRIKGCRFWVSARKALSRTSLSSCRQSSMSRASNSGRARMEKILRKPTMTFGSRAVQSDDFFRSEALAIKKRPVLNDLVEPRTERLVSRCGVPTSEVAKLHGVMLIAQIVQRVQDRNTISVVGAHESHQLP